MRADLRSTRIWRVIASDGEPMRVLNDIGHPPQPNVLFAGVQYLLMKDPDQELASFYPNLTERSAPVEEAGTPFRELVLANEPELLEIGRPVHPDQREPTMHGPSPCDLGDPVTEFHLVDIGTSAGLTLLMDREGPELAIDDGSGSRVVGQAQPHGGWLDLYARP